MSLAGSWFERVPKVELHFHLEGAIPLEALWELIVKYGCQDEVGSIAGLTARFKYRDFGHFLETWRWKNRFLREYQDFTFIAAAVARDLLHQRVLHAEAFFSPSEFAGHGLEPPRIAEAIRKGLDQVSNIDVLLVADLVRDQGPEGAARTLAALEGTGKLGLIGIGLGGSEHRFPPAPFAKVFERARSLGLHTSAHAGEAAGPESVWGALDSLRVERIGHGTRAYEDSQLVEVLAERRVHVETCPGSNVRTGVVASLSRHPVRQMFEAGVPLSVSTDDPKMFGTSLAEELSGLHTELRFGLDQIRTLIFQAARDCWLPPDRKRHLIDLLESDPAWGEASP